MNDNNNISKSTMSARTRIITAVVAIVAVAGGVFAIWYHHHKKTEQSSKAYVSGAPNIQSIPGAGNPSDRYVTQQNQQNTLLAQKARSTGGSAVPTITRPNFIGNPNVFATLPSSGAQKGSKACPIKKVVVMFRPNPANCSVNNLKIARKAGVTAEELACQGCSLQALKLAGYSAGALKNVGYSAAQLKAAGYNLGELERAGFSAKNLKQAGVTAKQLADAGFTAGQLAAAGYTPAQIQAAGFNASELAAAGLKNTDCSVVKLRKERAAGVSATTLKNQGCGAAALKAAGFTAAQLKAAGFTAPQLKDAEFTARQLKDAGFTVQQLKNAGFTAKQLKNAGFSAAALKGAGYSAADLKNAGFSNAALSAAGFTPAQINAADAVSKICSVSALKKARSNGVSAIELRKRGCGLAALKAAGFTTAQLKAAGFTAKQLKDAGFSAAQLRAAGFTAAQLKAAGFTAKQLHDAGYSADALKNAGFSAAQLKAAGFTAAPLKAAGFTAKQLRDAGYSASALRKAGFSATALKNAGFSAGQLAAAGFMAAQLKAAGFTAKQLRDAGFNAAPLKRAGYSAKQLKQAGYSDGDLLRAGFTPKQSGYASKRAAKKVTAQRNAVVSGAGINRAFDNSDNTSVPGVNSPEGRLAAIVRASDANMSAQERQDAIQQLQGAMQLQASRMVSEWGQNNDQQYQKATPPLKKKAAESGQSAGSGKGSIPGNIMKAGSVMFAVLDTSINTDEKSPILATIVAGPLKGSKLLGQFTRVNQRVLLSFNLINDPHYYKSIPINAVAIDPNTARTAVSGQVNNHYLLKYGVIFASAFLSGLSHAVLQSNATLQCFGPICVHNYGQLNTQQQLMVGLGTAGQQIASDFGSKFRDIPPTVKIKGGTGVGVLIMSDLTLPAGVVPAKESVGHSNR